MFNQRSICSVWAILIDFPPAQPPWSPWPQWDLFTWPLLIKLKRGHTFDKGHIDKDTLEHSCIQLAYRNAHTHTNTFLNISAKAEGPQFNVCRWRSNNSACCKNSKTCLQWCFGLNCQTSHIWFNQVSQKQLLLLVCWDHACFVDFESNVQRRHSSLSLSLSFSLSHKTLKYGRSKTSYFDGTKFNPQQPLWIVKRV